MTQSSFGFVARRNPASPLFQRCTVISNPKYNKAEDEIHEDSVKRAPNSTEHQPANGWEWCFVMQHYAAPTRLLDLTESPYLELYFAVRDCEGLHDAWV